MDMITAMAHLGVQQLASSTAQITANRIGASWAWYLVRGSGLAAAGLLVLLMLSGIGQVTGLTYRLLEPVKAWAVHKAMALALCGCIVLHVTGLLLDHYITFSWLQVLVPFTSRYTNGVKLFGISWTALGVTLGILAMYGIVVTVLSSLFWIDSKKKTWRWLHYLNYVVMLFVFLHGLTVGSDLKYGLFRAFWIGLVLIVAVGVVSRLRRARTVKRTE